jgi:hypothetical protein
MRYFVLRDQQPQGMYMPNRSILFLQVDNFVEKGVLSVSLVWFVQVCSWFQIL